MKDLQNLLRSQCELLYHAHLDVMVLESDLDIGQSEDSRDINEEND